MDSISSWVDPEEVKRLAESLMGDVEQEGDWETERKPVESAQAGEPVKDRKDVVRLSAEKSLAQASKLASTSGMLSGNKSKQVAKEEAKPADLHERQVQAPGVLDKLDALIREKTGANGVCVVDRDGDVLHNSMENESWAGLTISAASMAEKPDGGAIRMKVTGASSLQLIPASTSRGGIVIGVLLGSPVPQDEARDLAKKSEEIANG